MRQAVAPTGPTWGCERRRDGGAARYPSGPRRANLQVTLRRFRCVQREEPSDDQHRHATRDRISGPRAPIRRRIMATSVRAPVVAAVESATARETAEVAAQLASELKAPLTFIHVRPRPPASAGSVRSRRQSVRELFRAHGALGVALPVATRWGVVAQGEIVDGNPVDELVKAATRRKARLLVVGSCADSSEAFRAVCSRHPQCRLSSRMPARSDVVPTGCSADARVPGGVAARAGA